MLFEANFFSPFFKFSWRHCSLRNFGYSFAFRFRSFFHFQRFLFRNSVDGNFYRVFSWRDVNIAIICFFRLFSGSYYGAVTGIIAGIIICYMNLIIPQYIQTIHPEFSLDNYRILEFFKIPYLSTIAQVFFWSILVNSFLFAVDYFYH